MKFFADFHIHSKFSRATSKDMDLEVLDKWAQIKGVHVLATGDFTHPQWFSDLKSKLIPAEPGLFKLKSSAIALGKHNPALSNLPSISQKQPTRFILSAEISCIYSKNNRTRKIHLVILSPDFDTVDKINTYLGWIGNLKSDGRPILGLDAQEAAKIVFNVNPECVIIPAHIWTPWFSLFGSKSGFVDIEECFEKYTKNIFALETGLSSDPKMNWRWSRLDKYALVSNSDSHSPARIGREANQFDCDLSYRGIVNALKNKASKQFLQTIEFFPEEGKYHYDGHRLCKVVFSPQETKKAKGLCPKCGKPVVVGTMSQIDDLANRPLGEKPKYAVDYQNLIPLQEIVGAALGLGAGTKAVWQEYKELINYFGTEFNVLLNATESQISATSNSQIAEAMRRVRQGQVKIAPGYDGEYGKIKIFDDGEQASFSKQKSLI
ncbi:MAG: DNA helicase UvrD [Candidatus Portnoybacteria bacterium CG06_land_8_20_14_3_00_39_12]|uniref:DNA helicase UvrD n=3 Tax=Candidatus Portnoyibacteriota TaxID=1817913 RepID=A0A2M8KF93_9BACT|nr:MAG: DNA helicase UvrD [Parcubacteria group bacterium CG1_02_40_25]PIU74983.1 MAG: DNA helicase UvrD [Candidatus Portnoybacteria bacterium CG06_land_8_20_14_3_00_39_12]PIZ70457.1 MAG: DNA helicase UvrD [Candidatus Portnoybacteria bacterium CG_4_10_14_0_2_um_filter_39_11]PJE58591.1 MAG: DNA helicase UvrD [Candidatus Portnoybacteria bacterium CG10_big_fil_rev_8_21_14_0_10_40_22]